MFLPCVDLKNLNFLCVTQKVVKVNTFTQNLFCVHIVYAMIIAFKAFYFVC